ncbi:MAG: rRNA maturation RNase YbeY [bacterium]
MPVLCEIYKGRFPVNKKFVQEVVDKCANFLKITHNELSIAFVSDKEIRKMNRNYRNIDKTTDVLSFGMIARGKERLPLKSSAPDVSYAEIIISYKQAKKQAKENKIAIKKEIEKLLVHGLLHLAGYDHKTASEAKKMEEIEYYWLQK